MLGQIVKVTIDRPLGSYHPKHPDIYYPINYGYIEGMTYTQDKISELVKFQEQYFKIKIKMMKLER